MPDDKPMWSLALDRYIELDEKLRQWMVFYGAGIATLFVTQSNLMCNITLTKAYWILALSLIPAFIQVVDSSFSKFTNLVTYRAHHPEESLTTTSRWYRLVEWWATPICTGFILDIACAISYFIATCLLISALSTVIVGSATNNQLPQSQETLNGDKEENRQEESSKEKGSEKESGQEEGREEKSGQEKSREEKGSEKESGQEEGVAR